MRGASRARGAGADLALIGAHPFDQLFQVVRRHVFFRDDELRIGRQQRDRIEVFQEIIGERIDRAVDDMRAPVADAERVAVGRRAHDTSNRDRARGAGRVLDHDGLSERAAHALAENARDRVGRAAGREWHDQCDRTGRIRLRLRDANVHHAGERGQ
jgi:hypothetical protein